MTEATTDKALATTAEVKSISPINAMAREMASRLRFMIANGKKLADAEVFALAQYAAANDLNPFSGECYYLPGTGPVPGIAGWRKKAQEQLDWECGKAGLKEGGHIWFDHQSVTELQENSFDASKGDIAEVVILHDWLSNTRWRRAIFDTARQLREIGAPNAYEEAQRIVGPEPTWSAIGVVYGSEAFAADGKPEKFNRHERARKRAEKLALRKRFPRVSLPEPDEFANDAIDFEVIPEPHETKRSVEELQSMWGDEPKTTPAPSVSEPEDEPETGTLEPTWARPMKPEALRRWFAGEVAKNAKASHTPDQLREVAGCLDYLLSGKGARIEFLSGLIGKSITSSKDLPAGGVYVLFNYLKPFLDQNTGTYMPAADVQRFVVQEVTGAHAEWLKESGQETLFD